MTGIAPTPENFRAEMARHNLSRAAVADLIQMHPNLLSGYINETKKLPHWARHNIGYAINRSTGIRIFEIDMGAGVLAPIREHVRMNDPRSPLRLPTPPRRRRRVKS